jgi:hypothetical protein
MGEVFDRHDVVPVPGNRSLTFAARNEALSESGELINSTELHGHGARFHYNIRHRRRYA